MKRAVAAAAVVSAFLVGCSSNEPQQPQAAATPKPAATPEPSTVGGTVPVPTNTLSTVKPTDAAVPPELPEQATAPPPATAGPLSARNLPAPAKLGPGWTTFADPGGAEAGFLGNKTWTRQREAHQAAYEALPVGCVGQLPTGSLPVPQYALQGSYRTAAGQPAIALLLRFSDNSKATAYYTGYRSRMAACGSGGDLSVTELWTDDTATASTRQYAGAEAYTDISLVQGATVVLLAATTTTPATQSTWAHSAVPTLQAVIDTP